LKGEGPFGGKDTKWKINLTLVWKQAGVFTFKEEYMRCPESLEELRELEKLIPLCRRTLFDQVEARIKSGAAKNISDASRQLGEETGRNPESIRRVVQREQGVTPSHISEISGTDKYRPHVSQNSGENEWYTPANYIEASRMVMGSIDLDPASSETANRTVCATAYYTKVNIFFLTSL
jgi:hypothetical protein